MSVDKKLASLVLNQKEQAARAAGYSTPGDSDDEPDTQDVNAIEAWQQLARTWNTWFLRRPTGKTGDRVDRQWGKAIGAQKVFRIEDEQRAVDYAMGLIARSWGHFSDFQDNMRARQSEEKVAAVSKPIVMKCPRCGAPLPIGAAGMFKCAYCATTLKL